MHFIHGSRFTYLHLPSNVLLDINAYLPYSVQLTTKLCLQLLSVPSCSCWFRVGTPLFSFLTAAAPEH